MPGKPFNYLLLKIATRCNIDCTYCYWFRDETVYDKPKKLLREAQSALFLKLVEHIRAHELSEFYILLHGGEPLLYGKARLREFCAGIENVAQETGCTIHLSLTTNGILIDEEWAAILRDNRIDVTVSIDGPEAIHDKHRIDFKGLGTLSAVEAGLNQLRRVGISPGVLAVCDPPSEPLKVLDYFVNVLGLKKFDILVPDSTHEDQPHSIEPYFKARFDAWYPALATDGVDIRYLRSMMKGLLGGVSKVESIGYGPINTVCMLTDGSLEPLDVIRITGNGATATNMNIFDHSFEDMKSCPVWREAYDASMRPCAACLSCDYVQACGGGFLPHRYSAERGYDNPSVYCQDIKGLLHHIWDRIAPEVTIQSQDGSRKRLLSEAFDA